MPEERALGELTVVELASGWQAPLAGRLLADLGATVVKVERGPGDWLRTRPEHFQLTGAGKRSLLLDYTAPAGARQLRDLVSRADVLISDEQFEAGWLGVERLAQVEEAFPRLVHCSITPFGRDRAPRIDASDLIVQAAAGLMATTGFAGDPPTPIRQSLIDHSTALYGLAAILAALRARGRTGAGQAIDLAAFDCMLNYLFLFLGPLFVTGVAPARLGNRHMTSAPWNSFDCRDGAVIICTSIDEQWQRMAAACGLGDAARAPEFATKALRVRNVERLDEVVNAWTRQRTRAEAIAVLQAAGIPVAAVLSIDGLLQDANFVARGMVRTVSSGEGKIVRTSGSIFKMSETPGRVAGAAPALGDASFGAIAAEFAAAAAAAAPAAPAELREGPLSGVRVVELGAFGAGPFAARLLAELGADVVKLESAEGDPSRMSSPKVGGESYPFIFYNLNKRSVVLDLRRPADAARCRDLLATADVFIENLGPGAVERLGLGEEDLREALPALVYCSVSGFGRSGPYRTLRAFDTVIQAMSAVMQPPREAGADRPPLKIGISIGDLITPTAAAAAILVALHWRERSGRGQRIDISMQDVVAWGGECLWPAHFPGADASLGGVALVEGAYPSSDGRIVAIALLHERHVAAASAMLGCPASDEALRRWVAARPAGEAVSRCAGEGLPAAVALEIAEVVASPVAEERGSLTTLVGPSGEQVRVTQTAFRFSRTPCAVRSLGPRLGEHNAILMKKRES